MVYAIEEFWASRKERNVNVIQYCDTMSHCALFCVQDQNPWVSCMVVLCHFWASQLAKNPPANAGDARAMGLILSQEDPLKLEMVTDSSILAWKILWTTEPGRLYSPWDLQRVGRD